MPPEAARAETTTFTLVAGLPDLRQKKFWRAAYFPQLYEKALWDVERWWWTGVSTVWGNAVRRAISNRTSNVGLDAFVETAQTAMAWAFMLGLISGEQHITSERRRRKIPAEGQVSAAEAEVLDENIEFVKSRLLVPPPDYMMSFYKLRVPPIRGATEELQNRVADIVAQAIREQWHDKEFEAALRQAGRWPLARVRNQIRTETATLFNAGRFTRLHLDRAVAGYRYVVTLDDRTTEICRRLVDVRVSKENLTDVPPLHFQCRTLLDPIFAWDADKVQFTDPTEIPRPGQPPFEQFEGFGQHDLITRLAPAVPETLPPPKPRPRARRKAEAPPKPKPEIEPYSPKQTVKEALQWARRHFSNIKWNLGRMPLTTVNTVIAEFTQMARRYPDLVNCIERIGARRVRKYTYAQFQPWDRSIILNSTHFRRPDVLLRSLRNDVENRWHPIDGSSISSLISHELGHALHFGMSGREQEEIYRWYRKHERMAVAISRYANENIHEMFAEAILCIEHTPRHLWKAPVRELYEWLVSRGKLVE